jgi:hypothetical protein
VSGITKKSKQVRRLNSNPEEVFEALGLALMNPKKTSCTVTTGLQIMPMGPSAVFEEAALGKKRLHLLSYY